FKPGKRVQALPQSGEGGLRLADLLADGSEHGPDARGLRRSGLKQPFEATGLAEILEKPVDGLGRRQLARRCAVAEEVEEGGIDIREFPPRRRPARVQEHVLAEKEARQARAVGGELHPGWILGRESEQMGGRDAGRENRLLLESQGSDLGDVWAAWAE